MKRRLSLALALAVTGCAAHNAQVREFDEGRETPFFAEQAARARSRPEERPAASAPLPSIEPRARAERGVDGRDEAAGLLDLADPSVRAAFEAGASEPATEALLAAGPLRLPTLRGLVAARSPRVREARLAWRATVEQVDQARWLEEVAASIRSFARDIDTRVAGEGPAAPRAMERETGPWPAASALRGEMADREVARAREEARAALATALADAEEAHAGAWALGEESRAREGFVPILRAAADVAAARYAAGRGTREETLRAELEIRRMESEAVTARTEHEVAAARLNALLGRAAEAAIPEIEAPAEPPAPPPPARVAAAAALSPAAIRADLALELSRIALRMAEVMGHPVAAGSGPEMPSPLAGVEEAYLRELRGRVAAAEAARDAVRRDLETEAREACHRLAEALRELRIARDTALPNAEQAHEVSRRGFEAGSVSFGEHLEVWGALVDARLGTIRARRDAVAARAAVLRVTARGNGE